jgi:hypothetical protein
MVKKGHHSLFTVSINTADLDRWLNIYKYSAAKTARNPCPFDGK